MYESVFVFVFKRWLVKRGREEYNIRNITDVIRTGRLLAVTKIEHKFIVKTVYGINEQIIYFLLSFFPLPPPFLPRSLHYHVLFATLDN